MNNVLHMQPQNPDFYGLFANMTDSQNKVNQKNELKILWLKKRYEWMKAALIALSLFMIAFIVALGWAIYDYKTKPITVVIENKVEELEKLPIPPLEELKELK